MKEKQIGVDGDGLRVSFGGYEPEAIWLDEAGEADGRIWFKPLKLEQWQAIDCPPKRRFKRNKRKWFIATHRRMEWQRKARGWRKHLRKNKHK